MAAAKQRARFGALLPIFAAMLAAYRRAAGAAGIDYPQLVYSRIQNEVSLVSPIPIRAKFRWEPESFVRILALAGQDLVETPSIFSQLGNSPLFVHRFSIQMPRPALIAPPKTRVQCAMGRESWPWGGRFVKAIRGIRMRTSSPKN